MMTELSSFFVFWFDETGIGKIRLLYRVRDKLHVIYNNN